MPSGQQTRRKPQNEPLQGEYVRKINDYSDAFDPPASPKDRKIMTSIFTEEKIQKSINNSTYEHDTEDLNETSDDSSFNNSGSSAATKPNMSNSSKYSNYKESTTNSDSRWVYVAVICLVLGIIYFPYSKIFAENLNSEKPAEKNCTILLQFKNSFPGIDELSWKLLKVGVEHVQKDIPPQPTVFFILHHNRAKAKIFANTIASSIQQCLESESAPIVVTDSDLNTAEYIQDFGQVISDYKSKLERSNVMVVHDIESVDDQVVEAFHTICDKETPYVPKSVIIFTYYSKTKPASVSQLYDFVEETLMNSWKKSFAKRHNKIQPLITRMTENVLHLKS